MHKLVGSLIVLGSLACSRSPEPAARQVATAPMQLPSTPKPVTGPEDAGEPNPNAQVVYEGPAGLKWGQTPQDVRKTLSAKFEFVSQGKADSGKTFTQTYRGTFSGLATQDIEVDFNDGKLIGFAVVLPERDVRAVSKRWQEMVEKMREARGEPTEVSALPKLSGLSSTATDYPNTANRGRIQQITATLDAYASAMGHGPYDQLDLFIQKGEWTPKAIWLFKNKVFVVISVMVAQPDKSGRRALNPTWLFAGPGFGDWYEKARDTGDL